VDTIGYGTCQVQLHNINHSMVQVAELITILWLWVTKLYKVEVTLRLTVSESVRFAIEHSCGTCDQILLPVRMFPSEICCLVSVGHPLWLEEGSAICSVITQWSESLRAITRFPYSYSPGTGWASYTPRPELSSLCSLGTGHTENIASNNYSIGASYTAVT
jgi:hypothetical protein